MQKQATLRNHPNIIAGTTQTSKYPKREDDQKERTPFNPLMRAFKSKTESTLEDNQDAPKMPDSEKHCLFHDRKGHDLTNCKAFARKTLTERTEWIKRARLCFLCLSTEHQASNCTAVISCEKCGSSRHQVLLHMENRKNGTEKKHGEEITSNYTSICRTRSGGLSCGKIILLDVFQSTLSSTIKATRL